MLCPIRNIAASVAIGPTVGALTAIPGGLDPAVIDKCLGVLYKSVDVRSQCVKADCQWWNEVLEDCAIPNIDVGLSVLASEGV